MPPRGVADGMNTPSEVTRGSAGMRAPPRWWSERALLNMPTAHPPSSTTQRHAIGFGTVKKDLAPWLRPEIYPPIPPEGEDDWARGKGQTFEAYTAGHPIRPGASGNKTRLARHKIYLLPIGSDDDTAASFPSLESLAAGCSAFFGLETSILPMLTLKQLEARGRTAIRSRRKQVNAKDINDNLRALLPADGFTLCGVTMHDIYKSSMNYLFGLAFLTSKVGVFSFYRHQPNSPDCEFHHGQLTRQPGDDDVLLRRALQTLTHEIGHTFGLKHCVFFSCLMQGANSLEEAENRMPDLCPVCLRKLLWCSRAESAEGMRARYRRLHDFYAAHPNSFGGAHLAWVRGRLGLHGSREEHPQADGPGREEDDNGGDGLASEMCSPCEESMPSPTGERVEGEAGH